MQALFQSAQHLYRKREGSESGAGSRSTPLTNGSGSGSGMPKNMQILRIWIPNTGFSSSLAPPDAVHVAVPAIGGVRGGEALQLGGQNGLPQLVEAQPGLLSTLLQLITESPHLPKFRTYENCSSRKSYFQLSKNKADFFTRLHCLSLVIT
jgi:hypothetical protein